MKPTSWPFPNPEMWPKWHPKGSLYVQVSPPPYILLPELTLMPEAERLKTLGHFPLRYPAVFTLGSPMIRNLEFTLSPYPQSSLKCCGIAQGQSAGRQQSPDLNSNPVCSKATRSPILFRPLLFQEPLCVPHPKKPGHLNSLFPICANHVPTQCINSIFVTKTVFPQWLQDQHLCTCYFPSEAFFP